MKEIELPDGTVLEAPDDITPDGIKRAVQNYNAAQSTGAGVKAQTAPSVGSPVRLPIAGGIEYTPTPEDIGRGRAIGSVAMPLVGGAVGTALGGPGGGVAGAMAGTAGSQALGLEEPSIGNILLSGAGQGAPAAAGKLLTSKPVAGLAAKVAEYIPGISRLKLDKAATNVLGELDNLVSAGDSKRLWQGFKATGGVAIRDTPATKAAITDLMEEYTRLAPGLPGSSQLRTMINGLSHKFASGKPLDLFDLDANIKAMGKVVGKFEREQGIQLGAAKKFLAAMYDDLEKAPLTMTVGSGQAQAATALRAAAVKATKKAASKEELLETVTGAIKSVSGEGDILTIHPEAVLNRLRNLVTPASKSYDKNFATSLASDLPQITSIFNKLNKLSQGGGMPGSLVVQGMFTGGGAVVGSALGPVGAGAGAILGSQIPTAVENIILSPAGRAVLDRGLSSVISSGNKAALSNLFQLAFQTARRSASAPEEEPTP